MKRPLAPLLRIVGLTRLASAIEARAWMADVIEPRLARRVELRRRRSAAARKGWQTRRAQG